MDIILKKNWEYVLYEEGGKLLLSAVCGSVGLFDRNIYLNELETTRYKRGGEQYIEELAAEIRKDPEAFGDRHVVID